MDFRHDSWNKIYRTPFGAMPQGSDVTLSVFAPEAYLVRLRTYASNQELWYDMCASENPGFWEVTLTLPETSGLLWYDFSFGLKGKAYTYGTRSDHFGGEGQIYEAYPPSYQITIYEPTR